MVTTLVVIDKFTKIEHFIPTTKKMSIEGLAQLFRNNVWKLYGLSNSIILDKRIFRLLQY